VLFTNTGLIKQAELVTVRHRKLQHLLVLLARILAVTALVIMFAQPFIPAAQKSEGVSGGVDVLFDNSPSMQTTNSAGEQLWLQAASEAKELGSKSLGLTRFRLLNAGNSVLTPEAYHAKLDEMRINAHERSVGQQIALTTGQSKSVTNPLYVLSDFQKSQFKADVISSLGNKREVVLVPSVAAPTGNVYVDSVWVNDAFIRLNTNIELHIRLRNGGSSTVEDCPVKVFLGKRQVAAFRATVEPGKTSLSTARIQVQDAGTAQGRVVTEDAPVTFDNNFFFTLQAASTINVLEIGDEPSTQQLYGNEPLFAYSFTKPQNVNYATLRKANVVVVKELDRVEIGLQDAMLAVVKRGGSVVVVPSPAENSHASYEGLLKKLGLGTPQWEKQVTGTPELREVAMPSLQEPFFRDVFGAQQRAVTMPRAAPVLQWTRTGTDLLRLKDGGSYLAAFRSGPGTVYVFSAPFEERYSDFTSHALFVPVFYRMAMLSYRNEQQPAYRLTQPALTLKVPGLESQTEPGDAANIRLVKDSLVLIPGQRVVGQDVHLELPAGMSSPGFYEVKYKQKRLAVLAFNQDKRESELAAYTADELRQQIRPEQKNVRVLEESMQGSRLARFRAKQTGQPLWRYFLVLALLGLLAEAALIRFGRKGAGKPRAMAHA